MLTLNEKKVDLKNSKQKCGKKMSKYIDWVKRDLFGCFRYRKDRDKDNETGLKEREVIEMSTTVHPLRDARSFA